jgi:hypothetical protein
MAHEEYDSKFVRVKPTSRLIGKREVTFTCQRCNAWVTEWRYPGPLPQYCGACGPGVQKEKTAARTRRSRQRKKEQQVANTLPHEV